MIKIKIPRQEYWDEEKECFVYLNETELCMEHSLVSVSKWESKWQKPFMDNKKQFEKTTEEILDYFKCMTITQNVDPEVYNRLTEENIKEIVAYIENPMTATTFSDNDNKGHSREIVTSELIYYAMFQFNIPMECQKWHLNRLMTLIKVCSIKNAPPKKMSKRQLAKRNSALNAQRRAMLNSRG